MGNTWLRVEYSEGPLMDSLRFLSHPAPFLFSDSQIHGDWAAARVSAELLEDTSALFYFRCISLFFEYVLLHYHDSVVMYFYWELPRGDILITTLLDIQHCNIHL